MLCLFHLFIAVQHECIPSAILGMDILCQAKSGMGKTAVFVLAILQQLEPKPDTVSAIVMCHTRELAFQVATSSSPVSSQLCVCCAVVLAVATAPRTSPS